MDRIRVGLTGLAAVFLVTLGAALAFRPPEGQMAGIESKAGEPLAQLGVAPGADKESAKEAARNPPARADAAPAAGPAPSGPEGAVMVPAPFDTPASATPTLPMGGGLPAGASHI